MRSSWNFETWYTYDLFILVKLENHAMVCMFVSPPDLYIVKGEVFRRWGL
jgi:hypothetical protein